MQAIIDFITGISEGISSALSFLATIVEDIVQVASNLWNVVANIPQYLSYMPSEALALVIGTITIVVILRIIGR